MQLPIEAGSHPGHRDQLAPDCHPAPILLLIFGFGLLGLVLWACGPHSPLAALADLSTAGRNFQRNLRTLVKAGFIDRRGFLRRLMNVSAC